MRKLTTTLCLTIVVLLGSLGVSWSADLGRWEPLVMSWLESVIPFFLGFLVAAIIAAILFYKVVRNASNFALGKINETRHYSALDKNALLRAYRREFSNIMIRKNPERFYAIYNQAVRSKMDIKNASAGVNDASLTSLCHKYPSYSDFDILKSMEFYLYEDALTDCSLSLKDIEQTYLDIVKFQELMKIKDDKWSNINSSSFEDEYHNELNAYIRTLPSNNRDQTRE